MSQQNIFLLLGSNIGDRLGQLNLCKELIEKEIGKVIAKSKVYETAPWGKLDQPNFLNQALHVESVLSPHELFNKIQSIEHDLGRMRIEKWSERLIDIDIIYFGREVIHTPDLVVPHLHMAERKFVLIPLVEISPEFIHPVFLKSNRELLANCKDTLLVKEFIS